MKCVLTPWALCRFPSAEMRFFARSGLIELAVWMMISTTRLLAPNRCLSLHAMESNHTFMAENGLSDARLVGEI